MFAPVCNADLNSHLEDMRIVLTMPVFDDWEAAAVLCTMIDTELFKANDLQVSILMIDDGSTRPAEPAFSSFRAKSLETVSVLRLRRNLGHQRAIAIALAYIEANLPCEVVVVMDGDGEDRPEDILRLLESVGSSLGPTTVFAERGRRVETLKFKFFYACYRALHRLLTGRGIRIGNFSALPREHLRSIVTYPELWNHYAATVVNSRLHYTTIRTDRGQRLFGKSRMNFVTLVVHGLSALFAYHEVVSTRFLLGSAFLAMVFASLLLIVLFIKLLTNLAIPGWATAAAGLLFILIIQCIGTSLTILSSAMVNRSALGFLPVRDYSYFVSSCSVITEK
jgi:polyisoprenyl-phosphate glycosyltransferase